jgi:general secretion pathway protein A
MQSVQKYKPLAAIQNHLEMKTPLAMALIIILIIWVGLITIFLFSQKRTGTTQPSMNSGSVANHATAATDTEKNIQENDSWANDVLYASQQTGSPEDSTAADGGVESNRLAEKTTAGKQSGATQSPPSVNALKLASSDKERISLDDIQSAYGTFPEVHFGVNSNRLDDDGYDILAEIARFCMQQPETILILRGYTDLTGVRAYNMKLAEFRADVVKTYLIGKGVKPESITTMAIGPDDKGPGGTKVPYDGDRRKVMIEIITPAG